MRFAYFCFVHIAYYRKNGYTYNNIDMRRLELKV